MPIMSSHLRAAAAGAAELVWEDSGATGPSVSVDDGGDAESVGVSAWGAWVLGAVGLALLAAFTAFLCGDADDDDDDDEEGLYTGTGAPAWVAVCAQCNRKAEGDMDEDTQEFYCNECWDEWEDADGEGDDAGTRPRRMSAVGQAALSERSSNRDMNPDVSGSESDADRVAARAEGDGGDENLTWGTCLECRAYKLGEVDEFDDRFFCLECWDMWELQEDQEMSQRTPGGNYLGRRKSKAALLKFKKAASSVRAAVKMGMLSRGAQLGSGPSVGAMAALAARVEAKQEAEAAAADDDAGSQDDYVDECTQCGNTAMGSQDDQTGEFYCNSCWDQYEDEEEDDAAGAGSVGAGSGGAGAGAGAGAGEEAGEVAVSDLALGFPCSVCGDVKPGRNQLVDGRNQYVCYDCRASVSADDGEVPLAARASPTRAAAPDNDVGVRSRSGSSLSGSYTDSGGESALSAAGRNEQSTARLV